MLIGRLSAWRFTLGLLAFSLGAAVTAAEPPFLSRRATGCAELQALAARSPCREIRTAVLNNSTTALRTEEVGAVIRVKTKADGGDYAEKNARYDYALVTASSVASSTPRRSAPSSAAPSRRFPCAATARDLSAALLT